LSTGRDSARPEKPKRTKSFKEKYYKRCYLERISKIHHYSSICFLKRLMLDQQFQNVATNENDKQVLLLDHDFADAIAQKET